MLCLEVPSPQTLKFKFKIGECNLEKMHKSCLKSVFSLNESYKVNTDEIVLPIYGSRTELEKSC